MGFYFVRVFFFDCKKYAKNVQKTYVKIVEQDYCKKTAKFLQKICKKAARNLQKICKKFSGLVSKSAVN